MPYHNTSGKHVYANADRSKTFEVAPGEQPPADAAVLLVAAGDSVADDAAEEFGLTDALDTEAAKPPTMLEREKAGLESALKRRSFEEARVRRATIADLEAREQTTAKARQPAADKAVKAPAENKGA